MLTYEYTARDPATGQKVKSTVEAESEQAAVGLLQKQGLSPIEMKAKENEKALTHRQGSSKSFQKDQATFLAIAESLVSRASR